MAKGVTYWAINVHRFTHPGRDAINMSRVPLTDLRIIFKAITGSQNPTARSLHLVTSRTREQGEALCSYKRLT